MKTALLNYNKITLSTSIFWALSVATLGLLVAYVYLINVTVWNVAARQEAERSMANRIAEVSATESSYMTLTSKVSMDHAYAMGFQKTAQENVKFVHKSSALGVLPHNSAQ